MNVGFKAQLSKTAFQILLPGSICKELEQKQEFLGICTGNVIVWILPWILILCLVKGYGM